MTLPTFHTRTKELVNGESGLGIITAQIEILSYAKPYISLVESQASEIERQNKIIEIAKEAFNEINFPKIWLDVGPDRVLKLSREALAQITELERAGEKEG